MSYFLIHFDGDDARIEQVNPDEFLGRVEDGDYGDPPSLDMFLGAIPHEVISHWEDGYLLIKGEIVVPKPVQTVTKFKLE